MSLYGKTVIKPQNQSIKSSQSVILKLWFFQLKLEIYFTFCFLLLYCIGWSYCRVEQKVSGVYDAVLMHVNKGPWLARHASSWMKVRWPISHSADVCSSDQLQQVDSTNCQQGLLRCRVNLWRMGVETTCCCENGIDGCLNDLGKMSVNDLNCCCLS